MRLEFTEIESRQIYERKIFQIQYGYENRDATVISVGLRILRLTYQSFLVYSGLKLTSIEI